MLARDIEEFITGIARRSSADLERVLATVLFTDIVEFDAQRRRDGDQTWRRLLDTHDHLARANGREASRDSDFKNTGDGILATFDGPGAPSDASLATGRGAASNQIGLPLRAVSIPVKFEIRR